MHKFTRNLLAEWRKLKLPETEATFIVAVSGGADSVSLLLALHELRRAEKLESNFVVAHFNHDLRGAASKMDAEFTENLAEQLNLEFRGGLQNPESKIQNQKDNLEQSARRARYNFLAETAEKFNAFAVLTAHTQNDQAETFLLNLLRGSGASGLGAMKKIRKIKNDSDIFLIRPLLSWAKREMTENFALERQINFRLDEMNKDENFARVRVRKTLLPLLKEFNPKIVETLVRTAFLLQQEIENFAEAENAPPENLNLSDLRTLSKSALYGVLRQWLKANRGDLRRLDLRHIEAIECLISSRKSGRRIELPGGVSVVKKGGKLFFEKSKVEKSAGAN